MLHAISMEGLPAIGDLTAGGVLLLVVVCVLFGRLVTKAQLDALRADKDAEMARMERNHAAEVSELKSGNEAYRTVVQEQSIQIGELVRSIELPSKVMEALKEVASTRNEREV